MNWVDFEVIRSKVKVTSKFSDEGIPFGDSLPKTT